MSACQVLCTEISHERFGWKVWEFLQCTAIYERDGVWFLIQQCTFSIYIQYHMIETETHVKTVGDCIPLEHVCNHTCMTQHQHQHHQQTPRPLRLGEPGIHFASTVDRWHTSRRSSSRCIHDSTVSLFSWAIDSDTRELLFLSWRYAFTRVHIKFWINLWIHACAPSCLNRQW